jgi:hypothetical protein
MEKAGWPENGVCADEPPAILASGARADNAAVAPFPPESCAGTVPTVL